MFRLNAEETATVNQSQIVTGSQIHRDPRYPLALWAALPA